MIKLERFNTDVHRKREQRSRMELGGRLDKMGSAIEDVTEWEHRVEESQDTFQKISEVIKVTLDLAYIRVNLMSG